MERATYLDEFRSGKPIWASKAEAEDVDDPSSDRIKGGWAIEQPTHKLFNWWMNRADRRIEALEARVAWLEEKLLDAQGERL